MILLGVLGTEQSLFAPEKTVRCVLIAANVQQSGRNQSCLCDVAASGGNRLVFPGLKVMGGHMR